MAWLRMGERELLLGVRAGHPWGWLWAGLGMVPLGELPLGAGKEEPQGLFSLDQKLSACAWAGVWLRSCCSDPVLLQVEMGMGRLEHL